MDFLDKLLPAVLNGGTGGVIALALVWYLKARDSRDAVPGPAGSMSGAEDTRVEEAILRIAEQTAAQTELLRAQTLLLKECRDGHLETSRQLARVEAKLDVRRLN